MKNKNEYIKAIYEHQYLEYKLYRNEFWGHK